MEVYRIKIRNNKNIAITVSYSGRLIPAGDAIFIITRDFLTLPKSLISLPHGAIFVT